MIAWFVNIFAFTTFPQAVAPANKRERAVKKKETQKKNQKANTKKTCFLSDSTDRNLRLLRPKIRQIVLVFDQTRLPSARLGSETTQSMQLALERTRHYKRKQPRKRILTKQTKENLAEVDIVTTAGGAIVGSHVHATS
jgi:hypothetical protein